MQCYSWFADMILYLASSFLSLSRDFLAYSSLFTHCFPSCTFDDTTGSFYTHICARAALFASVFGYALSQWK